MSRLEELAKELIRAKQLLQFDQERYNIAGMNYVNSVKKVEDIRKEIMRQLNGI